MNISNRLVELAGKLALGVEGVSCVYIHFLTLYFLSVQYSLVSMEIFRVSVRSSSAMFCGLVAAASHSILLMLLLAWIHRRCFLLCFMCYMYMIKVELLCTGIRQGSILSEEFIHIFGAR